MRSRFSVLRSRHALYLAVLCTASAVATTSALPATAAPQPGSKPTAPATTDPAKAFKLGLTLWEAGEYAGALPLFQRAVKASGSPNARLYVARCLRDLGRLPEAYDEMLRTVKDATALAEKEDRYLPTRDTATTELAQLEQRVGKVIVVLPDALAGAAVQINGSELPQDRIGQPVSVVAGNISVVAAAADGSSIVRSAAVPPGSVVTVTLAPEGAGEPEAGPPPPIVEPGPDEPGGFGVVRAVGIGVAAVGVAGFVTFAVARGSRDSDIATLEEECGAGPCTDPAYQDTIDSGRTAETISGIGLGVGIAGVLAGTAMIIFGGPSSSDTETGWAPTPDGIRVRF